MGEGPGHAVGDALLKLVGERMQACVQTSNTVARIGGDEFVILLHARGESVEAARVAEEFRASWCDTYAVEGDVLDVSCSIGVAVFPMNGSTAQDFSNAADRAMYQAKLLGRNAVARSSAHSVERVKKQ